MKNSALTVRKNRSTVEIYDLYKGALKRQFQVKAGEVVFSALSAEDSSFSNLQTNTNSFVFNQNNVFKQSETLKEDIVYLAGEDKNIYVGDPRTKKPQHLAEVDTVNKIRNLKGFGTNSLAVAEDEAIFFLDTRKGELVSLLVHNIGGLIC